jgi:TPR repeat protein
MYEEGLGVPQEIQEAIRHYRAVAKVEPRATLALARIYASGKGVPTDPAEAVRLYSLVAEHDTWEHDADVVAFAGAVTSDEVEEAKKYLRDHQ